MRLNFHVFIYSQMKFPNIEHQSLNEMSKKIVMHFQTASEHKLNTLQTIQIWCFP